MSYAVKQICPLTFQEWSGRAVSTCSNEENYHCVEDEYSRIVEVCTVPIWIEKGYCPVYNTVAKKMDSAVCSGKHCPYKVFLSNDVYKYTGCQQFALRTRTTTSSSVHANTPFPDTSETFTIAVAVSLVLFVILLVVLGIILWRKKRLFVFPACLFSGTNLRKETCEKDIGKEQEKITPKELDADNKLISQCQRHLEKGGQTLAMFGKLGSGKRTLAAQVAIRIAKTNPALKIKIVTERDTITEDLESGQSTILIIHDPLKTWYTDRDKNALIWQPPPSLVKGT
nr:uncharacterized protein LOC117687192 [Crassostrea gigas]